MHQTINGCDPFLLWLWKGAVLCGERESEEEIYVGLLDFLCLFLLFGPCDVNGHAESNKIWEKLTKGSRGKLSACLYGTPPAFAAIFDLFVVTKSPIPSHHRRNKSKPNSANRGWRVWWRLTSWSYTLRHGGFPKFGEISILTSAVLDCLLRITTCKTHSQ